MCCVFIFISSFSVQRVVFSSAKQKSKSIIIQLLKDFSRAKILFRVYMTNNIRPTSLKYISRMRPQEDYSDLIKMSCSICYQTPFIFHE